MTNIRWFIKKAREFQKNIYVCFVDYSKAFDCVDQKICGKFLKNQEYQTMWLTSWEICMQIRKQLELDMEQQTGSKQEKEYIKAVYCHPSYLTYMQSTSGEMLGWRKHKLESRLPGEISITSDMQMTPPLWQKAKKNLSLMKVKEESEKVGLKLNTQKTKIMASGHYLMGNRWGDSRNNGWFYLFIYLFILSPKSLQMVIAAMKLKGIYSLEGKLWPT